MIQLNILFCQSGGKTLLWGQIFKIKNMPAKKNQKHGFPALLSFFFPGLGQLIKGHIVKAILIWLAGTMLLVLPLASILLFFEIALDVDHLYEDIITGGTLLLTVVLMWMIISFSFWVWNVYDAYNAN